MKQLTIVCALLVTILSCTKNNAEGPVSQNGPSTEKNNVVQAAPLPPVSVSSYGFLTLQTVADYTALANYLSERTAGEVLAYYRQIGFTCLAQIQQQVGNPDDKIPEDQQYLFMLNGNKMIQVNGFVLKLTTDDKYLLTMSAKLLTGTTHQQLAGGNFNPGGMNRFATTGAMAQTSRNLFDFLNNTPSGYSENPGPMIPMRKFWGHEDTKGPCDTTGHRWITRHYYIFWIHVEEHGYDYVPC